MKALPRTYGEVEGFITMLMAACEDVGMNDTLEKILALPDKRRRAVVRGVLELLRATGAPRDLEDAFVCLLDDEVAEKAYEVIYKCRRGGESPSSPR